MTLRLASSNDHQALAIRDRVLPLVRSRGTMEEQWGGLRRITLSTGPWSFSHWTPFKTLGTGEASSPGYRHAIEQQRAGPTLEYGLDIRLRGAKVLGLLWSDNGAFDVNLFERGDWETLVLDLAGTFEGLPAGTAGDAVPPVDGAT
ncbi:MAG: hypothetical protein RLO51_13285 [Thalassobaculum sp.]|uniref:hypothetical protein n=1 Tax=Thalassobaculum sp. TaxID=2022740 RepID=UPI0032ECFAAA